jgi:hypothetical protein
MIVKSDTFIYLISWFIKPAAITLWPFIIISPKRAEQHDFMTYEEILNHEKIHLKQQKELFLIGFYVLYVVFFVHYRIRFKNSLKAYLAIPFEREARYHQIDCSYLKKRKPFAWLKYKYWL